MPTGDFAWGQKIENKPQDEPVMLGIAGGGIAGAIIGGILAGPPGIMGGAIIGSIVGWGGGYLIYLKKMKTEVDQERAAVKQQLQRRNVKQKHVQLLWIKNSYNGP